MTEITDNASLSGADLLLLVEALDAFIPPQGSGSIAWGSSPPWTEEQRQRFEPFALLRYRLAEAVGMGFFDTGRTFLDNALREERQALIQAVRVRLSALLEQEGLTRRQLRDGMIPAYRELVEHRFYEVKMPLQSLTAERNTPEPTP